MIPATHRACFAWPVLQCCSLQESRTAVAGTCSCFKGSGEHTGASPLTAGLARNIRLCPLRGAVDGQLHFLCHEVSGSCTCDAGPGPAQRTCPRPAVLGPVPGAPGREAVLPHGRPQHRPVRGVLAEAAPPGTLLIALAWPSIKAPSCQPRDRTCCPMNSCEGGQTQHHSSVNVFEGWYESLQ